MNAAAPRRTLLLLFSATVLLALHATVAHSQLTEGNLGAVAAAADTSALEATVARLTRDRPDTLADYHVVRGFAALRRYGITGDRAALDAARSTFDHAIDLDVTNALARYGRGLARQRKPGVGDALVVTGRAWSTLLGFDDRAKARRDFARALELDPALRGAAVGLGEIALQTQNPEQLEAARDALARTLGARTADPLAVATLARVAAALGDSGTAVSVADRLTVSDAPPEALHAILWALAREPGREQDVGEAFYRLASSADDAMLDRLFAELQPVFSERELAAWKAGDAPARRALLGGMWDARATLSGTSLGERIAEHWRRLAEAVKRFPRQTEGPPPENALLLKRPTSPFDDRGAIYVRHGEPDETVWSWHYDPDTVLPSACAKDSRPARPTTSPDNAFRRNESWAYRNPDGTFVMYHFGRCFTFPDFVLLYRAPCEGRWTDIDSGFAVEMPKCGPLAEAQHEADARRALATDSDRPRFDRTLPVIFDLLAFRGKDGRTDLVAPVAVAADSLATRIVSGETVYGASLMLAVVDTSGRIARLDTSILAGYPGPLEPGSMISTHVQLSAVPSEDAQLRIVTRGTFDETAGSFYGTQMKVPDYSGDSIQVSSLVLALPDTAGEWRRGSHSLTLMPLGRFEGGEFRVFYEVYGLEPEQAYVTEVTVERAGRRGPEPIRLRFQDFAQPEADGIVRDVRRVETGLPPGRYRITVQVTDPRGERAAQADREFVVIPRPGSGGER